MNSKKYAGWEIEKGDGEYFMTRPDWEAKGIKYAILVYQNEGGEWAGESMVWVERHKEYIANKTSEYGPVPAVVKEIERRAEYWLSRR